DTAVAVHPDDERYQSLIGKMVVLPLIGREIPVVADEYVETEFGTGVVKITPAHDFNDFEVGLRHGLDKINVFDESGNVNAAGHQYEGLNRFAARTRIVAELEAAGLLEKVDDHAMSVGGCYRCKTVVEPYLSLQWYVKVAPLAERALAAVKDGRTRILPKQWENTYYDWMENIRDWCISRQVWWGHRIPAWFCEHCDGITVSMETPAKCSKCGSDELRQETDVLDTWFSSALWPFSTMGWPEKTPELKTFYPTACLVTGFDILFFWVARMMMMGLHFMDEVPFRDVYIHALVRDAQGQKMSKSKGNVIDPLTIIEQYGTDAFRFTLAAFAAQGRDIKLAEERIAGYRNFCNKVWNAARFTLMNLEGFSPDSVKYEDLVLSQGDKWILHRLNETARETARALEEYRYNEAAMGLYQFTWSEFCDWYLELSKKDLYGDDQERKSVSQYVLWHTLENLLRLLHPFMPFITEEIWQALPGNKETPTIMQAAWPEPSQFREHPTAAADMEEVMAVISAIRNIRGEMEVPPSREIAVILSCGSDESLRLMKHNEGSIISLVRISDLAIGRDIVQPQDASIQVAGDIQIFVPLKGLVDVAAEEERLLKEIGKIEKEIEMFSKKLESPAFVDRAPAEIVAKERQKLAEVTGKKQVLEESLDKIRNLK
ncbi:MAG: valine--tRNA ligase, partial [Verrucomicrobia bacterium]|nr:valine--tRNA ligase [Deltaproteobacteria bacterium]